MYLSTGCHLLCSSHYSLHQRPRPLPPIHYLYRLNFHQTDTMRFLLILLMFSGLAPLAGQREERLAALDAGDFLLNEEQDYAGARAEYATVIGPLDSLTGLAQHQLGLTYHRQCIYGEPAGAFDAAVAASVAYREAIATRDAVLGPNHQDGARSRRNLAAMLIVQDKWEEAGTALREATGIYAAAARPDTLNWLRSLSNLLEVAMEQNDYRLGMSAAATTGRLLNDFAVVNPDEQLAFEYGLARAYQAFDQPSLALPFAQRARWQAESIGYLPLDELNLLLILYTDLGRVEEQVELAEHTLSLLEAQPTLDTTAVALLHVSLARMHFQADRPARARIHADYAYELMQRGDQRWLPTLLSLRGNLELISDNAYGAHAAFKEGLLLLDPAATGDLPRPHPDSLRPDQLDVAIQLLGNRAALLANSDRPLEALADYELLFLLQDRQREQVSFEDSYAFLSQELHPYFDRAIDLLTSHAAATGEVSFLWDAFELSERAKAYGLVRTMLQDRSQRHELENRLRRRIAELERLAAADSNAHQPALEAAQLQLDRMLHARPRPGLLQREAADGKAVLSLLAPQEKVLLAYHIGAASGHLFTINGRDSTISHQLITEVDSLAGRVEAFRAATAESAYRRKSLRGKEEQARLDASFVQSGLTLYGQLFHSELPAEATDLIIVPDGPLAVLPFASLPTDSVAGAVNYADFPYLQRGRTLTYAHSTQVLQQQAGRSATDYDIDLLAYAPTFGGTANPKDTRAVAAANLRALEPLRSLKFNGPEVEYIAGLFPDHQVHRGAAANRENFLAEAGRARIIHLSTHGFVDAARPALSFVAFTQATDSLQLEEMLYLNDLHTLNLRAELAVLSACETSLGTYVPGEHTSSLASAFTAAGARSTLSTLWQVDDEATQVLVQGFYRGLAEGLRRDAALARAQAEQAGGREFAHPYYWAGLTLYGEAGPLVPGLGGGAGFGGWWLWGLLGFFGLVGGFLLLKLRG